MIHALLGRIVVLLRAGLVGAPITNVNTQIVQTPPSAAPRPMVAVYPGNLTLGDMATDMASSEPRPMQRSEEFAVNPITPQGPYVLGQTPLEGTALGKLIFDKDGLDERRRTVQEKKDFVIDYPSRSISFISDVGNATHLSFDYAFAGVFFLQDFQQEFYIEALAGGSQVAERLSSLAATVVFTQLNELINFFNQTNRTVYSATQYQSEHWIGKIAWKDSITVLNGASTSFRMRFVVNGQVKHIRANIPGFGIIESIRSAGTPSAPGINIVPELG